MLQAPHSSAVELHAPIAFSFALARLHTVPAELSAELAAEGFFFAPPTGLFLVQSDSSRLSHVEISRETQLS